MELNVRGAAELLPVAVAVEGAVVSLLRVLVLVWVLVVPEVFAAAVAAGRGCWVLPRPCRRPRAAGSLLLLLPLELPLKPSLLPAALATARERATRLRGPALRAAAAWRRLVGAGGSRASCIALMSISVGGWICKYAHGPLGLVGQSDLCVLRNSAQQLGV